jgi:hypothetical protein
VKSSNPSAVQKRGRKIKTNVPVGHLRVYEDECSPSSRPEITRILEELKNNDQQSTVPDRSYEVTEQELNAYLSAQLYQQDQKAVESIALMIKEGTFLTRVEVNADELQLKGDDVTMGYLMLLLRGTQTLEVEGKLQAQDGVASYLVQEARLSGISLPAPWVNSLLSSLGKRNNPPFDPTEPVPMPYGIQSVTFQPGKMMMETGNGTP